MLDPPGVLDFGVLQPGESAARPLLVLTQGDLDLDLFGLRPVAGLSFTVDPTQSFPVRVPPGGQTSITLLPFQAAILGRLYAEFEVLSNDPAGQQVPPRLSVVGIIAGPRIRFTDFLDLGVDTTVHRAYVANNVSNNVTVIDTTLNTVVGAAITVGAHPLDVGIGP